jgi:uncharacterized iron-regulated membrane protein
MKDTKQQAKWIRSYRWVHQKIAVPSFVFLFIIAATGLLLGIKKQTGLLAPTKEGSSKDLTTWLPIDSLSKIAVQVLHDSVDAQLSANLDRIDIRPHKGIVKFVFSDHYWGLQLDGTTGKLLHIEKRNSDLIENIHDGSILDRYLGSGEGAKVTYTVLMGSSLLVLILSGFWLWYGPKRLRQLKKKKSLAFEKPNG